VVCQSPPGDRTLAQQLAKSGRTLEALTLFEQIVRQDPSCIEGRLWIGRLLLRMGRTDEAEARFRAVLAEDPSNIDARIGLGAALTRSGAWSDALTVLTGAEPGAGENADLFGALARAYRRAGDDRRALAYYDRAKALAPDDPDAVDGFEATAHAYGHSIAIGGFGEGGATDTRSVSVAAIVRVLPRLRLEGRARLQRGTGFSDALGGGGAIWRITRSLHMALRAAGGSGNTSLPASDVLAAAVNYAGAFEIGGSLQRLSFADVSVIAAAPRLAWDTGGRWRLDGRYTYSRSSFDVTGESSADHSVLVRETWRGWRRVDVHAAYAYGIESFEDLTADRLEALGATTMAVGLRIRAPSLTFVTTTWEHQWRSNETRIDRLTLSLVQSFP
jgi:tetratricopeptide (TPR) repeat protein